MINEEVGDIIKKIDNYEIFQSTTAVSLEEKYKERIAQISRDKDKIIIQLKEELEAQKKENENLSKQIINQTEENRNKIYIYENNIRELEQKLLKKDEQIFIQKSQIEGILSQYEQDKTNEKINIESEYEKKIQCILDETEKERNKILSILKERENDIQNLIKNNQQQSTDLLNTARKLKEENADLNNQLQSALNQQKMMENNVDNIKQGVSNYDSNLKEKKDVIEKLKKSENENEELKIANKNLNEKIKKLEAMIYGKIKPFIANKKSI